MKTSRSNYGRNPRETLIEILQKTLGEVPEISKIQAESYPGKPLREILESTLDGSLKRTHRKTMEAIGKIHDRNIGRHSCRDSVKSRKYLAISMV